jgi:hypothetical protein
MKVVYTCPKCPQVFEPKDLYEMTEVDEGEHEYLCPNDNSVLKWRLE